MEIKQIKTKGICESIQFAATFAELYYLLDKVDSYIYISRSTNRRAKRLFKIRKNELTFENIGENGV